MTYTYIRNDASIEGNELHDEIKRQKREKWSVPYGHYYLNLYNDIVIGIGGIPPVSYR